MWSGPRSLSTALMRSFASRRDCSVIDEPFYAAYLKATGIAHPMRNLILDSYNTNPLEVAKNCLQGNSNVNIQYQKHMAHHMIPSFDNSFTHKICNAFLIRSPKKVVKSFGKKIDDFSLQDLGFVQQVELFSMIFDKTGIVPPVIDADDLLANPSAVLAALCSALEIDYYDEMLNWSTGTHSYDGVWGDYWYGSVNKSSGFLLSEGNDKKEFVPQTDLIDKAEPYFQTLNKYKISF